MSYKEDEKGIKRIQTMMNNVGKKMRFSDTAETPHKMLGIGVELGHSLNSERLGDIDNEMDQSVLIHESLKANIHVQETRKTSLV